jgi:BMFP domain-containing protein YqiC
MAEPQDMILPLLREMRAENLSEHKRTRDQIALLEKRIGKLEEAQVSFRQALGADSLLSKLVTGEFEERIVALERRVRELEAQK